MSMLPKIPRLSATATSCWKLWPARVAWFASMLTRYSSAQVVADQERVDRRRVVVVLVLRGLLRLGLEEQGALEADAMLVLGDQRQESCELLLLAPRSVLSSVS